MPTFHLVSGIVHRLLDAVAAGAIKSAGLGIPQKSGLSNQGRTLTWRTLFTGGPSAVSVTLEGAMNDVDAEYKVLDTSTVTGGEQRTVQNVVERFVRAQVGSMTGGATTTVEVLG